MGSGEHTLLKIYIGENDIYQNKPLYVAVLENARQFNITGCTVIRGISGLGASGIIHSNFPPDYAVDLPLIIEIVDSNEKTSQLLNKLEPLLEGILITEEKVHVQFYQHQRLEAQDRGLKK